MAICLQALFLARLILAADTAGGARGHGAGGGRPAFEGLFIFTDQKGFAQAVIDKIPGEYFIYGAGPQDIKI